MEKLTTAEEVKFKVNPSQIGFGKAVATGLVTAVLIVKALVAVFTQPLASVPVTVIDVAVDGLAVIGFPDEAERTGVPVPAHV